MMHKHSWITTRTKDMDSGVWVEISECKNCKKVKVKKANG